MASIFEKISNGGRGAVQKVKDANEISRINLLIQAEEQGQKDIYSKIGQKYYERVIEKGEIIEEPFSQLFDAITQSHNKIAAYQADIIRIKNVKRCPACGRECSDDSLFCSGCGNQLSEQSHPSEASTHCMNCGAEIAQDDLFCFSCGKKIER